jgi:hypothetical protein
MRRFLSLLLLSLSALCGWAQTPGKLLLTYVSHNEDNYPYLQNPAVYYQRRPQFIAIAQNCQSRGVAWNMGNDHVLLRAVIQLDTAGVLASSGGKNILRFLNEELGVEMDPHTHEMQYWHPDIAYLYDSLGVQHTHIMGGYAYNQEMSPGRTWMVYQDSVQGNVFSGYKWLASALWGAAVPGHVGDPLYFGVWKPDTLTNFVAHNPSRRLPNIGGGCNYKLLDTTTVAQVLDSMRTVIDALRNLQLPPEGFYTASLFSQENSFSNPQYRAKLYQLFDSINVWRDEGLVEWVHLSEILDRWQTERNSQPWVYSCALQPAIVTSVAEAPTLAASPFRLWPNPLPAGCALRAHCPTPGRLGVMNAQGQTVYQAQMQGGETPVALPQLPTGVYYVRWVGAGVNQAATLVVAAP